MANIELKDVTYRYAIGGVEKVSFTLPQGEIACLLGPSGSGKTTLLKLISGFLLPQQGQIHFNGKDVSRLPPQKRHVGLVFQQHALFPHLTVEKNILYGYTGKDKQKGEELLSKLLEDFHIRSHRMRYPHHISGGEQQRVALARAIASEPSILLMDEPFSSLDKGLREQVRQECLNIVRARNLTTLIVTHDEEEAEKISDKIIRIEKTA
ncbi:MAG: ABC transporter ATP-binding protein [Alphaproteobacteria bacterium]|nr:ABC transporter ATP-binding protein [Alphaproteobacteria bacterium]